MDRGFLHSERMSDMASGLRLIEKKEKKIIKKQYKEIRKISAIALRQLCVDHDWYTAGDNDEYDHLLHTLAADKENLSSEDIVEIAEDIMTHSKIRKDYTVADFAHFCQSLLFLQLQNNTFRRIRF